MEETLTYQQYQHNHKPSFVKFHHHSTICLLLPLAFSQIYHLRLLCGIVPPLCLSAGLVTCQTLLLLPTFWTNSKVQNIIFLPPPQTTLLKSNLQNPPSSNSLPKPLSTPNDCRTTSQQDNLAKMSSLRNLQIYKLLLITLFNWFSLL